MQPDRLGHNFWDQLPIMQICERDEGSSIDVVRRQSMHRLESQSCLADATYAEQRHQSSVFEQALHRS
jgi:hypothetical protein